MAIIVALSFGIDSIPAQTMMNAKEMRKQQKEGRNEVREATKVFREIMSVPEKGIPRELLEKAEAVGVFPNVVKAGFIVGGRGGDGVVARRTAKPAGSGAFAAASKSNKTNAPRQFRFADSIASFGNGDNAPNKFRRSRSGKQGII